MENDIKNMQELIKVCMELNRDDFHVFLSFSGHVNCYSVHYYHGGEIGKPTYPVGHCAYFEGIPTTIELLKTASENNQQAIAAIKASASEAEYLRLKALFEGK